MLFLNPKYLSAIFSVVLALTYPALAMEEVELDLEGNGHFTKVELPFKYCHRQDGDQLDVIHQGGYKVYDLETDKNSVGIFETLRPCIAIAVTDGQKLVLLHKHSTNSLLHMKDLLAQYLRLESIKNWCARVFTTRDDVEWAEHQRAVMHDGKSHLEVVKEIRTVLLDMGMESLSIPSGLYNIRKPDGSFNYPEFALKRYELAEQGVAVRVNDLFAEKNGKREIKFYSVDAHQEDVYGYRGTQITLVEFSGPNLPALQAQAPRVDFTKRYIAFDGIPKMYSDQGDPDGYLVQRGISQRRINREMNECYERHFGQDSQQVIDSSKCNSLEFFQLN